MSKTRNNCDFTAELLYRKKSRMHSDELVINFSRESSYFFAKLSFTYLLCLQNPMENYVNDNKLIN